MSQMSGWDAVSIIACFVAFAVIFRFLENFAKARAARRANASATTTKQGPNWRGRITFENGRSVIELSEHADASTFMHVMAHFWLEQTLADATHELASDEMRADAAIIRKWLGAATDEDITYKGPDAKRAAAATEMHERYARAQLGLY